MLEKYDQRVHSSRAIELGTDGAREQLCHKGLGGHGSQPGLSMHQQCPRETEAAHILGGSNEKVATDREKRFRFSNSTCEAMSRAACLVWGPRIQEQYGQTEVSAVKGDYEDLFG